MTKAERSGRIIAGLALLLMVPSYFAVRLRVDTEFAAPRVPGVVRLVDEATVEIERRTLMCRADPTRPEQLSVEAANTLIMAPLVAVHDLNSAFNDDDILWFIGSGLPLTKRAKAFREASAPLQDYLSRLKDRAAVICQGTWYSEAEIKEEEIRGQKDLTDGLVALREHRVRLATAWEALDGQRPVLGVVAWSLGLLELVGWGLLFVNLPRDLRTLRAKRAERRGKTETK